MLTNTFVNSLKLFGKNNFIKSYGNYNRRLLSIQTQLPNIQNNIKPTQIKPIRIFEVGPRDGLQNEKKFIPTNDKINLIKTLLNAGLTNIELTSFVSPKAIPQFSDAEIVTEEIMSHIKQNNINANLSVLVPNEKGMNLAIRHGIKEVAIFTSASEAFNKKNINCSIEESFKRFEPIMALAQLNGIKVRGYVSCIAGCPYSGQVDPNLVIDVTKRLLDIGVYEVSLGDTIGIGKPEQIDQLLTKISEPEHNINVLQLAGHFHNTNGLALENIKVAIKHGIRTFDSSVGGLGGCPYAVVSNEKKAIGNVSTESVLSMINEEYKQLSDTNINYNIIKQLSTDIKKLL